VDARDYPLHAALLQHAFPRRCSWSLWYPSWSRGERKATLAALLKCRQLLNGAESRGAELEAAAAAARPRAAAQQGAAVWSDDGFDSSSSGSSSGSSISSRVGRAWCRPCGAPAAGAEAALPAGLLQGLRGDALFLLRAEEPSEREAAGKIVYLWALMRLNEFAAEVAEALLAGTAQPSDWRAANAAQAVWKAVVAHFLHGDQLSDLVRPDLQLMNGFGGGCAHVIADALGDGIWHCCELFDRCGDGTLERALELAGRFWASLQEACLPLAARRVLLADLDRLDRALPRGFIALRGGGLCAFARQGFAEPLALYQAFRGARLRFLTVRDVVLLVAYGTLTAGHAPMLSHRGADVKPGLRERLGAGPEAGGGLGRDAFELDASFVPVLESNRSFVWRLVATAPRCVGMGGFRLKARHATPGGASVG
jgi:hypothetical protein